MAKIKPLTKKHRFRRFLRRIFGRKPRASDYLATIDEMHKYFCPWVYIQNIPVRTAPVTCILKCTDCGVHIPRAVGVNYHFCPECGARKTDRYVLHTQAPDGLKIEKTIIDELHTETMKVMPREEHEKMHKYRNS